MPRKGGVPQNLIPIKKGEVRNPRGPAKKLPGLKEFLAEFMAKPDGNMTKLDAVFAALYKRAKSGDVRAIQELLDRTFHKSHQTMDLTSGDKAFNLTFNVMSQDTADEINRIKED